MAIPVVNEQVHTLLKKLAADTEDMFNQQQQLLKLSYNELCLTLERLRYKVQYSSNSNNGGMPSVSNGMGEGVFGLDGDRAAFSAAISSTPLRSNGLSSGGGFSALNSVNAPSSALGSMGIDRSNMLNAMNGNGGGFHSGGIPNNNNNNHNNNVFSNPFSKAGTSTPPNKHLILSGGQSPTMPEDPLLNDWSSLSVANQFSPNPPASQTVNGSPFNNVADMLASPQTNQKMPLEDLLTRFGCQSEPSPSLNFDAFYEQLIKDDRLSTDEEEDLAPGGERKQRRTPATEEGNTAKDIVPVEMLPPIHDRYLTTHIKASYGSGRPVVEPIEGGKEQDYAQYGIQADTPCQTLVEFKGKRMIQYESDRFVKPGTYVIVGGDRGEDLGLAIYTWCEVPKSNHTTESVDVAKRISKSHSREDDTNKESPNDISNSNLSKSSTPNRDVTQRPLVENSRNTVVGVGLTGSRLRHSVGIGSGKVLREATKEEVQQLHSLQAELERRAIDVCTARVLEHNLPMAIAEAEYQFDKKKLTFYYEAQQRMDFRELVRDLYKTFRARIWMELVEN